MKDWIVFRIVFLTWAALFCNLFYQQQQKRETRKLALRTSTALCEVYFFEYSDLLFKKRKWHFWYEWMNSSILHRFIVLWARPWTGMNLTRKLLNEMEANCSQFKTVRIEIYSAPLFAFDFSAASFLWGNFFVFIVQCSIFILCHWWAVSGIDHSCNMFHRMFFYYCSVQRAFLERSIVPFRRQVTVHSLHIHTLY